MNVFSPDYEEFSKFACSENTHCIWNYVSGYTKGETEKLTGMKIKEISYEEFTYIEIKEDDSLEILENYGDKSVEYEKIPPLENIPKIGIKTAVKAKTFFVHFRRQSGN